MNDNYILKVDNINKYFGKFQALKDISFNVSENEIVGFIGPNGAGKSTTMKCINSLIFPDTGTIRICGYDLATQRDQALSNMASMIESPGLRLEMSGRDNLELFALLRNVKEDRIEQIIDFVHIGDFIDKKVKTYSLGMKQRLALGIVLLSKPKFIILDEPSNGLDPTAVIELRNTLLRLCKEEGISILFSSHQLGEIDKIADRIICIKEGELVEFNQERTKEIEYHFELERECQCEKELLEINSTISTQSNGLKLVVTSEKNSDMTELLDLLQKNNRILHMKTKEIDIEQVYLDIFGTNYDRTPKV